MTMQNLIQESFSVGDVQFGLSYCTVGALVFEML